ncbi:MAG: type IV secretory system conjugative DNA transfer family protein [Conexivisphaerales archaeon]
MEEKYISDSKRISSYKSSSSFFESLVLLFFVFLFSYLVYKLVAYETLNISLKSAEEVKKFILNPLNFGNKTLPQGFNLLTLFLAPAVMMIIGVAAVFRAGSFKVKHPYSGVEQGSARFAIIPKEVKPLIDEAEGGKPYYYNKNNIIFTKNVGLSLNTRKTFRNNNVLVIGGSGTGKTRYFVKPNLLQAHSSYIVTDPKGEISREVGYFLRQAGFRVRIFDLIDMEYSSKYNPFNYFIKGEDDVIALVETIVQSVYQGKQQSSDAFWEKAEVLLLSAIMSYIFTELPKGDRNIATVMDILRESSDFAVLDTMFAEVTARKPDAYCSRLWDSFKVVREAGKTLSSILITATTTLQVWNQERVRRLMMEDTVELDKLGDEPTALFIVIPDSTKVYNFIAAMMYKQLFTTLYYKADKLYNGPLPMHVRFILDEFPNIGKISDFEQILSTVRSRNISCSIIIQNTAQLKDMYSDKGQDAWENVAGNCSTILYLGGREYQTMEYISKLLGKATIDVKDESLSKGKETSKSESVKKQSRELLFPDEVGRIKPNQAIVVVQNSFPFLDYKFELKEHPNYMHTAEVNGKMFTTKERLREEVKYLLFS